MKRKAFQPIFILILLLLIFIQIGFAHPGGHSSEHFRNWQNTAENTELEASFLSFDDENVVFETHNSETVRIPIINLSKQDHDFVNERIDFIKNINSVSNKNEPSAAGIHSYTLLMLLFASGTLFLIIKSNQLRLASVSLTTTAFSFAYLACSTTTNIENQKVSKNDVDSMQKAFGKINHNIKTRSDDKYFYVESNGIPEHNMMIGIKSWQQQVPIEQPYTGNNAWTIPLQPILADDPVSTKNNFFRGAIGLAVNGVPIFNALNNRGDDAFLVGELDKWGGHCGRADDYHYHTAPLHLEEKVGNSIPIAFALDGFAVYGSKEPGGSVMEPLDENNGHFDSQNSYHYHGTKGYPYMIGRMRGEVTKSWSDEITPQPRSTGIREYLQPLNGAEITDFKSTGKNSYSLEYTLAGKKYYINYKRDDAGKYTFEFVSEDGPKKTETFNKRN